VDFVVTLQSELGDVSENLESAMHQPLLDDDVHVAKPANDALSIQVLAAQMKQKQLATLPQSASTESLSASQSALDPNIGLVLSAVYVGIQITLLLLNTQGDEELEKIDVPFHLVEFWAVFCFTILNIFYLINSKTRRMLLSLWIIEVMLTLIAALIISIDMENNEPLSHWIEYCAQIPLVIVDITVSSSMTEKYKNGYAGYVWQVISWITLAASILQLVLYAGIGHGVSPERSAHYCEFSIETVNGSLMIYYWWDLMSHKYELPW